MTTHALHTDVLADQWKDGTTMVECYIHPSYRFMTGAAVRSQLTLVVVVLFMAREAIYRCAFVVTIHMAIRTGDGCMRTRQFED